jgi:hypothetical protein
MKHMISSVEKKIGQSSKSFNSDTSAYPGLDCSYAVRGATVAKQGSAPTGCAVLKL